MFNMKKILFLSFFVPVIVLSQPTAIQFEKGLSWEQVKAKAKKENKIIFVDFYTTWCGPCKLMEKEVYVNDTVARFFNERFVSVQVQMDETEKDGEEIKNRRKDADALGKLFRIESFPTYVFVSHDGRLIHKETGFKFPQEFLRVADTATLPGKVYDNPYAKYDQLIIDWKNGNVNFNDIPYIVYTAQKIGDSALRSDVMKEYKNRMKLIPESQLYSKEHLSFMASVIGRSSSEFFPLFYTNGKKVNQIMNKRNYAQNVIDRIIVVEEVLPFINVKLSGMQVLGASPKKVPQPDWKILHEKIAKKYNSEYAKRNVLEGKIMWFKDQKNLDYTKYFAEKWKKYGSDTTERIDLNLNTVAWVILNRVTDKERIDAAIEWMKGVVNRSKKVSPHWNAVTLDTYAGLIYKRGKKNTAIILQQKAVEVSKAANDSPADIAEFQERLEQMKKNKLLFDPKIFF
jgi:thioredoxin-related protein